MNSNQPFKPTKPAMSPEPVPSEKLTVKRDEITKLRCATDSEPWSAPVDEFAAWIDEQIVRLEDQFAQYSTVSGRRKSFSR